MSALTVLRIVAIVVVIIAVVGIRLRGTKVRERRAVTLPAILAIIGVVDLVKNSGQTKAADWLLLAVSVVFAVGLGAARGATIKVFAKEGNPWQRYTAWTVLIWVLLVAARFGVILLAHSMSAAVAAGTTSLLLLLGLSLLAEGFVVLPRARALGLPLAAAAPRRTMP